MVEHEIRCAFYAELGATFVRGKPVINLRDIDLVTDFQRHFKRHLSRMKNRKTPLVLTVNGRAELVVQDAQSYQKLLNRLRELEEQCAASQGGSAV